MSGTTNVEHLIALYHEDGTITTLCGYVRQGLLQGNRQGRLCANCRQTHVDIAEAVQRFGE